MLTNKKEYQCVKCNHVFSKTSPDNVIMATLPKCPFCGSEELRTNKKQFTKGVLGVKESREKEFKTVRLEKDELK